MGDIKLFGFKGDRLSEYEGSASALEKPLQNLFEKNLETLLGVRFLATEYSTGKTHAGRIDTLGLDENDCPVILEYKRSSGENVINQGLFYLDWLLDHQAELKLLVLERLGQRSADAIDWSSPRLICIAADFTKYDGHAVQQMNRNIDLVRYRRFGTDLLLLEQVNSVAVKAATSSKLKTAKTANSSPELKRVGTDKPVTEWLRELSPSIKELFESTEGFLLSLGDDVLRKDLKLYIAFKRIKNFTTIVFQKDRLLMFLRLNPERVETLDGFARDVRDIGHWGTGDLELTLKNLEDLDRAKPLIELAYEGRKTGD